MTWNAFSILVIIALILSIVSLFKPTWPASGVAILLVCIALLIKAVDK